VEVTIGRIVHYKLTSQDVQAIQQQREQLREAGFEAQGDQLAKSDIYPAMVVKVFGPEKASLQVHLPGTLSLFWVPQAELGADEGEYLWPTQSAAGTTASEQQIVQARQREKQRA
jgi:hypothetical protein